MKVVLHSRKPLHYADGESRRDDRPAFVRAASGLCWFGDELAIVQDDTSFLALHSEARGLRCLPLPRGAGGRRRFEDELGNRLHKPDLEALVAVPTARGPRLLAFGSGSLPLREVVALIDPPSERAEFIGAMTFCQRLRDALELGPDELNIEGAALVGDQLRFFQRRPSASIDVDVHAFVDWLLDAGEARCPPLGNRRNYELGSRAGVAYGFTDAAALDAERIVFCAAAEDTDDPVEDGAVLGSLIGIIGPDGVSVSEIVDAAGEPIPLKAEGIAADPARPGWLWLVHDSDDPESPAELCSIELSL